MNINLDLYENEQFILAGDKYLNDYKKSKTSFNKSFNIHSHHDYMHQNLRNENSKFPKKKISNLYKTYSQDLMPIDRHKPVKIEYSNNTKIKLREKAEKNRIINLAYQIDAKMIARVQKNELINQRKLVKEDIYPKKHYENNKSKELHKENIIPRSGITQRFSNLLENYSKKYIRFKTEHTRRSHDKKNNYLENSILVTSTKNDSVDISKSKVTRINPQLVCVPNMQLKGVLWGQSPKSNLKKVESAKADSDVDQSDIISQNYSLINIIDDVKADLHYTNKYKTLTVKNESSQNNQKSNLKKSDQMLMNVSKIDPLNTSKDQKETIKELRRNSFNKYSALSKGERSPRYCSADLKWNESENKSYMTNLYSNKEKQNRKDWQLSSRNNLLEQKDMYSKLKVLPENLKEHEAPPISKMAMNISKAALYPSYRKKIQYANRRSKDRFIVENNEHIKYLKEQQKLTRTINNCQDITQKIFTTRKIRQERLYTGTSAFPHRKKSWFNANFILEGQVAKEMQKWRDIANEEELARQRAPPKRPSFLNEEIPQNQIQIDTYQKMVKNSIGAAANLIKKNYEQKNNGLNSTFS